MGHRESVGLLKEIPGPQGLGLVKYTSADSKMPYKSILAAEPKKVCLDQKQSVYGDGDAAPKTTPSAKSYRFLALHKNLQILMGNATRWYRDLNCGLKWLGRQP